MFVTYHACLEKQSSQKVLVMLHDIAISPTTFYRLVGEDVFFANPRSGAAVVVNNGRVLLDTLTRTFQPIKSVFAKIAADCNIAIKDADDDFRPLIKELLDEGLLYTPETNNLDRNGRIISPLQREVSSSNLLQKGDPVGNFYRERKLPLALHIDITASCTERCVHCYLPDYPQKNLEELLVEKAVREFREMGGYVVYISGGECMLHPQFKQILRLCRELDLNIIILSNLTLCDAEMVTFLKEISPQYINVSLYSMKPEEHDSITSISGSCEKTKDAILRCLDAGINVRVAAPLLKINKHAFKGLKDFTDKHNIHLVPDFGIVAKCNHDKSNIRYACSGEELENVLRENRDIFDMGWAKTHLCEPDETMCDIGVYRLHLNARGDYYPCPSMYGYVLGNVRTSTVGDVWRGEKLDYLRSLRWKDLEKCSTCAHRTFCEPCVAYNFNASGDLFKIIPEKCRIGLAVHRVYGA